MNTNHWCRIWTLCNPVPIRNFFMNSISKSYPKSKNYGLRYPIRNHSLGCTLAQRCSTGVHGAPDHTCETVHTVHTVHADFTNGKGCLWPRSALFNQYTGTLGCTKICVGCTTTKGFTRVHHKLVALNR